MGKGSQNTIEIEPNSLTNTIEKKISDNSKIYYTRKDVSLHNKRNDLWVIINENVYDLTKFQKIHPGGSKLLSIYAGQDASEVFNAFHKEFDKVNKYSKLYHIGQVHPKDSYLISKNINQPTENNKIEDIEKIKKLKDMRKDFLDLRKYSYDAGLFKPSYTFFLIQGLHIVFFQFMGFYILWNFGCSILPLCFSLICHVIAQAQAAWTQHDYGHSSIFAKPKHNQYVQMFFLGLIKGASAEWWTYMHNQHHAKPNVIDTDPDVKLAPVFVLGDTDPKRRAERNASGKEKLIYKYSLQHFYFPFVAPLLFPLFFQVTTIRYAIRKQRYLEILTIILMFVIQFGFTYPVFLSVTKSFAYFLVIRSIESSWFAWISQSNHIPMEIHDDDKLDSWLSLQLKATCNIEKSFFNDWFTGHLNFQIEHHLFPLMPRHNYYKIQPLVQSLCKKHGIDYVVKPLGTALLDILLSLKKSGEVWEETYNELLL